MLCTVSIDVSFTVGRIPGCNLLGAPNSLCLPWYFMGHYSTAGFHRDATVSAHCTLSGLRTLELSWD